MELELDTIKEGAKTARNRGRRIAEALKRDAEGQAARHGKQVVVAMDRAQRTVSELGEDAYETGQRIVRQATQEIRARPWTVAFLLGGAMLAGASCYMLLGRRR
jgi:ElaB/YqjD/DUF883 family membrane-anchored ribosome-binding protein